MSSLLRDVRHSARSLRQSPGFTAVAVLTLAIGIGANTAIFSFVDAMLLRPLPYPDADRIVRVMEKPPRGERNGISTLNFLDWQRDNTVFDFMSAQTGDTVTLTGGSEPVQLRGGLVSAGYFKVFGTEPALGRTFLPGEDQLGKDQVAVISHSSVGHPVRRRSDHRQPHGPSQQRAAHDRRRPAGDERVRSRTGADLAAAGVQAVEHDARLPLDDFVCQAERRRHACAGARQHGRDRQAHRKRLPGLEQGLGRRGGAIRRDARSTPRLERSFCC